jgi:thioredoxin-like negative regulator of GroEL
MTKTIISEIVNRDAFVNLLKHNTGLIILKLGAKWCGPCKNIEHVVHAFFATAPTDVICGDIDIDVSFDFYSFLKSKKMVNGIPVMLCYKKGNETFIPDDMVTGAEPIALDRFFKRCGNHLDDVRRKFPPTNTSLTNKSAKIER